MARELVLVPKSKYEHLLKLVKDNEQTGQGGGGQVENANENTSSNPDKKMKDTTSNEKISTGLEDNITENKASTTTESKDENGKEGGEEKARLYVDKPLAEMPFDKAKFIAPRGKMTNRLKEKSQKQEKRTRPVNGRKRGAKAR